FFFSLSFFSARPASHRLPTHVSHGRGSVCPPINGLITRTHHPGRRFRMQLRPGVQGPTGTGGVGPCNGKGPEPMPSSARLSPLCSVSRDGREARNLVCTNQNDNV